MPRWFDRLLAVLVLIAIAASFLGGRPAPAPCPPVTDVPRDIWCA